MADFAAWSQENLAKLAKDQHSKIIKLQSDLSTYSSVVKQAVEALEKAPQRRGNVALTKKEVNQYLSKVVLEFNEACKG